MLYSVKKDPTPLLGSLLAYRWLSTISHSWEICSEELKDSNDMKQVIVAGSAGLFISQTSVSRVWRVGAYPSASTRMAGREGLVDTAAKPAETGYIATAG
jgi:hypothetical protein